MIPLTHVCRYWRESIISTPENWTQISSRSKSLAALSLQRAKAAPLEICLDMRQIRGNPGFSDLITPHIQNIETLRIDSISTIEEFRRLLPDFPQSMPNLRSISLSGHAGLDWSIKPIGSVSTVLAHLSLVHIPLYPLFPHLRTLTDLTLRYHRFDLHLDILLDFLEENCSLERVNLYIRFTNPALRSSRRRVPIGNRLQSLTIISRDAMDGNALISNIALQRGAQLEITLYDRNAGLNDLLSIISKAHLSNLKSPTHMRFNPSPRNIQLLGPNGSFSFKRYNAPEAPFESFPLHHLTNIRSFYLMRYTLESDKCSVESMAFPPSSLPALETFIIEYEFTTSHLFSELFLNPSSSPSLNTLAFLNCYLDEGFMDELVRFASNRKNTTSARLHRVVIVNSRGILPRFALLEELGKHVPVVEAQIGKKLPTDLI